MARTLRFGTDGVRGRAGRFPIDPATAWILGLVLGSQAGRVLVARDSRSSGPSLCAALAAGVRQAGAEPVPLGLLPTPALSVLLSEGWGERGVMVTASHNPPHDNGLKVLGADGHKLGEDAQQRLQDALNQALAERSVPVELPASVSEPRHREAFTRYLEVLRAKIPAGRWLEGERVVLDASFGAGAHSGPAILEALGAELIPLACEPDGERINVGCGAVHPEALAALVVERGASLGVGLDGDADRGLLVSASGRVLDGDALLYLLASPPAVVGTIMSGGGLEEALTERGIELVRTPVGDRYVDAAVHGRGVQVGAETSGHVCLHDGLPTADGMLSCLRVLAAGCDLDARLAEYHPWPRVQRNVAVTHRPPLDSLPELCAAQERAERTLGAQGRTLLRYSGTEPLLRVLVEGRDETLVRRMADELVQAVRSVIGAE
jgi:phosphoglucosamine mutase